MTPLHRITLPLVLSVALFVLPLGAQVPAVTTGGAFDRADRDARALLSGLHCRQGIAAARAKGLFGPADSLGGTHQCLRVGGRLVGSFLDTDSVQRRLTRWTGVDLGTMTRLPAPHDSGAVLAVERAKHASYRLAYPAFEAAERQFTPVAFRTDGDSIAVWLMPIAILKEKAVGGEHGFLFSPDGTALVRQHDAFAEHRDFAVGDSGTVHIASTRDSLPTMSELVLANMINVRGRRAAIVMRQRTSVLTPQGGRSIWLHLPHPTAP